MTDEMMNLRAFVEKTPDADLLRKNVCFAAQRLMELEVESLIGASRDWETRAGTVELRIPKLRKGSYFPGFLEPRVHFMRNRLRSGRRRSGASAVAQGRRPAAPQAAKARRLHGRG